MVYDKGSSLWRTGTQASDITLAVFWSLSTSHLIVADDGARAAVVGGIVVVAVVLHGQAF